ncbi:OsmC family protein [Luteibacter aegosomatissinici]|uniref:OsmC family protein n=1 Tax=Luteibacter aegosomatissinici TaxID=2911539 RepID=UPI001FF8D92D|nr:OsmC family protein [Luteibacter aegosomatissinici]UPG94571.1 OsmC family protein [Luteibacter aegosomatissinici]
MSDSKPVLVETTGAGGHQVAIAAQGPTFFADEPAELGGLATGPTPYELLGGALGACTAMTMQMYTRRKAWPVARVQVAVAHSRDADGRDHFDRQIYVDGPLDDTQMARLMEIAERCPVGKTLSGGASISSQRVSSPPGHAHEPPRDTMHEPAMVKVCDDFDKTG